MYDKIVNPETNKKVSIYGRKGKQILMNYLNTNPGIYNSIGGFRTNIENSDDPIDKLYVSIRSINPKEVTQDKLNIFKNTLNQQLLTLQNQNKDPLLDLSKALPSHAFDDYLNFKENFKSIFETVNLTQFGKVKRKLDSAAIALKASNLVKLILTAGVGIITGMNTALNRKIDSLLRETEFPHGGDLIYNDISLQLKELKNYFTSEGEHKGWLIKSNTEQETKIIEALKYIFNSAISLSSKDPSHDAKKDLKNIMDRIDEFFQTLYKIDYKLLKAVFVLSFKGKDLIKLVTKSHVIFDLYMFIYILGDFDS